jgi:hypothetical protein
MANGLKQERPPGKKCRFGHPSLLASQTQSRSVKPLGALTKQLPGKILRFHRFLGVKKVFWAMLLTHE